MEDDYVANEDYRPYIPDGLWDVECIGYEKAYYRNTPRLYLKFRVVSDGPYNGIELFMAFNMPYDGRIPVGSKYYKTWSKVNEKLPSRNAKMSPRLFVNRLYRVKTRTVRPINGGEKLPDRFFYSVIDSIIEPLF